MRINEILSDNVSKNQSEVIEKIKECLDHLDECKSYKSFLEVFEDPISADDAFEKVSKINRSGKIKLITSRTNWRHTIYDKLFISEKSYKNYRGDVLSTLADTKEKFIDYCWKKFFIKTENEKYILSQNGNDELNAINSHIIEIENYISKENINLRSISKDQYIESQEEMKEIVKQIKEIEPKMKALVAQKGKGIAISEIYKTKLRIGMALGINVNKPLNK
jgi:hypothetical protein